MSESEDPVLLAVAEAVTDGLSVDWVELESKNPSLRDDLRAMHSMADVATAYRILRDSPSET
jgi:hypothetical protein